MALRMVSRDGALSRPKQAAVGVHSREQAQNKTDSTTGAVQVGLKSRNRRWVRSNSEACWLTDPRVMV